MSFTSITFFIFLGILIILYYALPHKAQWALLLVGSYVFYAFAGWRYLPFLIFTTLTTYLGTFYIAKNTEASKAYLEREKETLTKEEKKAYRAQTKKKSRVALILVLAVNLAILFFCKALLVEPFLSLAQGSSAGSLAQGGLALGTAAAGSSALSFLTLGLPMGMSFYMFQSLGYLIDVYRDKAKALKNPFKLALFTSFFPQLIQGPISQFSELEESLFKEHTFDRRQIAFGLQRMLWGFFKKMVVADRIAVAVQALSAKEYNGVGFFILTIFFAIQLYADFSGGIDIAIGVAQTLGVTLPENFNRPYFSRNIADFWRRWHITLFQWMKRYIFYPISVSKPMLSLSLKGRKKLGRFGMRIPVYIATFLTWMGTGIWHGFHWHFILWGFLNCVFIVVSEELTPAYEKFHARAAWSNTRGYDIFQIIRTFLLMNLIQVTDLFPRLGEYFGKVASLAYVFNFHIIWDGTMGKLGLTAADYIILLCGVALMFAVSVIQRKGSVREQMQKIPRAARYAILLAVIFAVIIFGSYGIGYDAGAFIYNQF